MKQMKIAAISRFCVAIGLLMASLGTPLSAYKQGSYLLFEVREDGAEANASEGRIVVAASFFKSKAQKLKGEVAGKEKKSAFETEITSFRSDDSDSVTTGIEILDEENEASKSKSSFGESTPASGGFFFTY
jgi:hypothetical protein